MFAFSDVATNSEMYSIRPGFERAIIADKIAVGKGLVICTVGNDTFSGGSNGICTLGGCTSIGTLGVCMGNCGDGGAATAQPRRLAI